MTILRRLWDKAVRNNEMSERGLTPSSPFMTIFTTAAGTALAYAVEPSLALAILPISTAGGTLLTRMDNGSVIDSYDRQMGGLRITPDDKPKIRPS